MEARDAVVVPISAVNAIGNIGPYHMDVMGKGSKNSVRGPFSVEPLRAQTSPTYPILWAHQADAERRIMFSADSEGVALTGKNARERQLIAQKVAAVWNTASHLHFNRDFQFNSQSTAMQFTTDKTIGGRAWLSISLPSERHEKALALWANTSLGLLLHWWHANKQQSGRGSIGKVALEDLPVLDVTALTEKQLAAADKIFGRFSSRDLLPLNEIVADRARQELDVEFLGQVLHVPAAVLAPSGPLELLRRKLAKEPSIHGGKIGKIAL